MVARFLKRHRRWIELALGFAVLVWLGWHILEREVVAEPELLIDKFRVTVFSRDIGPRKYEPRDSVSKWNGPVRLGLHGNAARYREVIDRIAAELTRLTGLAVGVVDLGNSEPPNFHIYFADPDKTLDLLLRFKKDAEKAREMSKMLCMASGSTESNTFTGGYAIVKNDLGRDQTGRCLLEEITQSLGLEADSELVQPSIFSNYGPHVDELPMNDKILVRALYDPRITPGMKREKVMEIAREIIPELVRAVRERGVEALYQR